MYGPVVYGLWLICRLGNILLALIPGGFYYQYRLGGTYNGPRVGIPGVPFGSLGSEIGTSMADLMPLIAK